VIRRRFIAVLWSFVLHIKVVITTDFIFRIKRYFKLNLKGYLLFYDIVTHQCPESIFFSTS